MNKIIIVLLIGSFIGSNAFNVDECWKDYYRRGVNSIHDVGNRNCGDGGVWVAGLCYGPCGPGETRQSTGWCKKSSGVVYISSVFQPKCNTSLEEIAGLCYPFCKNGYKGIGILCWQRCDVNQKYKSDCGMYCGPNGPYCDARNINIVLTLGTNLGAIVANPTLTTGINQISQITDNMSTRKVCDANS